MSRMFGELTEDEAMDVLVMTRLPQWHTFKKYLKFQEKTAISNGMALNHTPEKSGYFKGIYGLALDIQNLPDDICNFFNKKKPADDGFVALDGADAP